PTPVRHRFEVIGAVLVVDELLPGAGPGADVSGQSRLPGGIYRRHDAEGFAARPGSRARREYHDPARCGGGGTLWFVRGSGAWRGGFFRHNQIFTWVSGLVPPICSGINSEGTKPWRAHGRYAIATSASIRWPEGRHIRRF